MDESYLAVDIGTSSIKVVEKDAAGQALRWGILERRGRAFHSSIQPLDAEDAAGHLRTLMGKMGSTAKTAIASIPAFLALTAEAELPEPRFILAPPGTFTMSAIPVGWNKYFLAAIPHDIAEKYARIFRCAGLRLERLELESAAAARALARDAQPVLIVDIGGRSTTFTVGVAGLVNFFSQTDFAVASHAPDVIMKEAEKIAQKVSYKKIILCGGGAMLANLTGYVAPNSFLSVANGLQR